MQRRRFVAGVTVVVVAAVCAYAGPPDAREIQIKAAFLYNFVKFTDWPATKVDDSNQIVIGIISDYPLADIFEQVISKPIKDKKLIAKDLGSFESFAKYAATDPNQQSEGMRALQQCHLLFICQGEAQQTEAVLRLAKGHNVLTVAESPDALEAGAIIRIYIEANKIVFDVNLAAAQSEQLQISSQVLRLAKKLVPSQQG